MLVYLRITSTYGNQKMQKTPLHKLKMTRDISCPSFDYLAVGFTECSDYL